MSGFYGGLKGADFRIKKVYNSYEELKNAANNFTGENLNLGDWVSINYSNFEGMSIFLSYHASLWQVCSSIEHNLNSNSANININDNLFFRLIHSGLGVGVGEEVNSLRVANGGDAQTVKRELEDIVY